MLVPELVESELLDDPDDDPDADELVEDDPLGVTDDDVDRESVL